jgi:hypothetical protein
MLGTLCWDKGAGSGDYLYHLRRRGKEENLGIMGFMGLITHYNKCTSLGLPFVDRCGHMGHVFLFGPIVEQG